jgi:hypothetical protein
MTEFLVPYTAKNDAKKYGFYMVCRGAAAGGRRGGPRWRGDQPITRDGFTPTDRDYLFKYFEAGRRVRRNPS